MNSRRNFIKTTAAGAVAISLSRNLAASTFFAEIKKRPIHVFTKCLQFLNFDEMAALLAEVGFDGADLPVRKGGQVLPENVANDLPKVMKALQKNGIGSNMIVTDINNPDDALSRSVLRSMADLGIRYYRMGYVNYDDNKTMPQNLDIVKSTFEKLEKLNREFGVCGNYQNHSGGRVGGPVWDLYHILKDCDPEFIGVQYDIRHATAEGGVSWPLGMKLLSPWIGTTDIKDFIWQKDDKGQWKITNVPLGEGMVDFKKYFELFKSYGIEAPVSIHYEYDLGGAEHGKKETTMEISTIKKYMRNDLAFLKNQFEKYGL